MPQIFDNIDKQLLPTLSEAMTVSERGDFCVGYFNLRGWRQIDARVEKWTDGEGHCCRNAAPARGAAPGVHERDWRRRGRRQCHRPEAQA